MADVYPEAMEAARKLMHEGMLACDVHKVVADTFARHGFALGHLSGHSIGTTMIEHPAIGAKSQIELKENMIFSLHPQVIDQDGEVCLYTQDTFRVGLDRRRKSEQHSVEVLLRSRGPHSSSTR